MNALVTIETLTPSVVFAPGGVESILSKLEAEVRAISTDISTEAGRVAIKSLAYKVARSKTALDEMGKDLVSDLKAQAGKIDAERRVIRDRLDALRDEVRKPVDDFDNVERARIDLHEATITAILEACQLTAGAGPAAIQSRLIAVRTLSQRDWQEFSARATAATDTSRKTLEAALGEANRREAEAAELARLRAEQVAREQAEREAKIAAEAAERARIQVEAKAAGELKKAEEARHAAMLESDRAENERREAQLRADAAEAARVEQAAQAERDKKAAAEAAERKRLASVEAERQRIADAAAKEAAEKARREADKAHRAKFNNEALAAIQGRGLTKELGMTVLAAIVRGEVPHISINY